MSRQDRFSWFSAQQHSRRSKSRSAQVSRPRRTLGCGFALSRRLHIEALEDRRMLAVFSVSNLLDGPVVSAGDLPGSLRQAIFDSNAAASVDEIQFSVTGTIPLSAGELQISDALTITGPGQNLLTLDAGNGTDNTFNTGDGFRIFDIDDGTGSLIDVTLSGLTLTGGDTANGADGSGVIGTPGDNGANGGAIRSLENLTLINSTIIGNATGDGGKGEVSGLGGEGGHGGGIYISSGALTIIGSTISGNATGDGGDGGPGIPDFGISGGDSGDGGAGGGIVNFGGILTITDSTISNNATGEGRYGGAGGGVSNSGGSLTITGSTISGNATGKGSSGADGGDGGGVSNSGGSLTITGSAISGNATGEGKYGGDGGGVSNSGSSLTITGSTISGNATGYGSLGGDGGDGGGISSAGGSLTISGSTISGNATGDGKDGSNGSTGGNGGYFSNSIHGGDGRNGTGGGDGGGIFISGGTLTITNSTISGNASGDGGDGGDGGNGGVAITPNAGTNGDGGNGGNGGDSGDGGGISSSGGTLNVTSSTISGNVIGSNGSAGSGGLGATTGSSGINGIDGSNGSNGSVGGGGGVASLGDIFTYTNTEVGHTIISGNSGDDDVAFVNGASNSFTSLGYNLIGGGNALSEFSGDGTSVINTVPGLAPLADNGGPTETHALLVGSPAIDAGDPSIVFNPAEFDQRGAPFVRVFDGGVAGLRIDIGAVERQTQIALNLEVDTTVDENDGDYSAGDLSLREAVGLANGSVGADTIAFDAAVFTTPQSILLSLGEINISEAVTIDGPGQQLLTIDAQQNSRIFNITATTGDFTLAGQTLTGGRTTGDNGGFPATTFSSTAARSARSPPAISRSTRAPSAEIARRAS